MIERLALAWTLNYISVSSKLTATGQMLRVLASLLKIELWQIGHYDILRGKRERKDCQTVVESPSNMQSKDQDSREVIRAHGT